MHICENKSSFNSVVLLESNSLNKLSHFDQKVGILDTKIAFCLLKYCSLTKLMIEMEAETSKIKKNKTSKHSGT